MFDHSKCTHDRTKVARAACRRAHTTSDSKKSPAPKRTPRLPSVIAPKLRPIIDAAKQRGLNIRVGTDAPDGVEQMFIITGKGKPNCQLVAEAFQAASTGREGRASFWHIEDERSRQLSAKRALEDLDRLVTA